MDVIKIIQGGRHRKSPGRRIMMIKTRVHVPDQLVLRVHARIPEWCRCPDPVTASPRAAAADLVYRCPVIRDENASDDPSARGVISPGACVRCRFCGFYSVRGMITCRRMWDTMDFYAPWIFTPRPDSMRRWGSRRCGGAGKITGGPA